LFNLATRSNPSGIGQNDNLEQDGRIVGRAAGFIIVVAVFEDAQVEFMLDKVAEVVCSGTVNLAT